MKPILSHITLFTAALALAAMPQIAAAQDKNKPLVIEPSSPWNVDYGKETCRLARVFGEGENRYAIFFTQWGPSSSFSFTAGGPGFKRFQGGKVTLFRTFDEQEPKRTTPLKGNLDKIGPALIYSSMNLETAQEKLEEQALLAAALASTDTTVPSLPKLDTEFAAKTSYIAFKQRKREVILNAGPMGEAFKVLNDCSASLIAEWGLDLEQHKTMTRPPIWTNQQSITRRIIAKYPATALTKGEQAIVNMRVNIDETGSVTQCTIGKTTDTNYLNSPACGPMQKAKFEPALDKDGQPMPSYYRTSITYVIG